MTEFKVGDEVTFNMADFEPWQGGKGIVRKVDGPLGWGYKVQILEVPPTNNAQRVGNKVDCNAAMLKLVKPEPKFKKGDWAKVVGFGQPGVAYEGRVGQVTSSGPISSGEIATTLEFKDFKYKEGTFADRLLVPAAAPTVIPPKPKFEEGDLVRSIGFQYNGLAGKSLMVEGYHEGENTYPVKVRAVGEAYENGHSFREDELELVKRPVKTDEPLVINATLKSTQGWQLFESTKWDTQLTSKVIGKFDDPVNSPSHYTQYPVEVIELTRHMPFDEGNVVKYVARAPFKGNKVQDLKKARYYLDDAIKQAELEEAK